MAYAFYMGYLINWRPSSQLMNRIDPNQWDGSKSLKTNYKSIYTLLGFRVRIFYDLPFTKEKP